MSRLVVLMAPKFIDWPLRILEELHRRDAGIDVAALVTGPRQVLDRAAAHQRPVIAPLHHLDSLERKWLACDADETKLAHYRQLLGNDTLRQIVTADRQLGAGFVHEAILEPTPLSQAMRERKGVERYLVGLLDFCFDLIDPETDLVFCYTVAGAPAYAMATVARHQGVPFLQLAPARFQDRYVVDDSVKGLLSPIRRCYEAALADPAVLQEYHPQAHAYLREFRTRPQRPDYQDIAERADKKASLRWLRERAWLLSMAIRTRPSEPLVRKASLQGRIRHHQRLHVRNRRRVERTFFEPVGAARDAAYAYFPLHVVPEASTLVMAPMHTFQLPVIEAIAKSLPVGMELLVKEHVPMLGLRPDWFYERLLAMPGVRLVSPRENTHELIRGGSLTCTITGTAAFEALLLQRPVLVVAETPWNFLGQGIIFEPDLSRMPAAIERALFMEPASDDILVRYLAALRKNSFPFPTEAYWGHVTPQVVEQNRRTMNDLVGALGRYLGGSPHD